MRTLISGLVSVVGLSGFLQTVLGLDIPGYKTTYEIKKEGNAGGPVVTAGDEVTVHATGIVKETGKKFWSTKDPG